jgi:hypothetical protein
MALASISSLSELFISVDPVRDEQDTKTTLKETSKPSGSEMLVGSEGADSSTDHEKTFLAGEQPSEMRAAVIV